MKVILMALEITTTNQPIILPLFFVENQCDDLRLLFSLFNIFVFAFLLFFLFSLRMCLLVSLLLLLLFSFLNHFYCLCLICLISLFSLFDAFDFHVQSTLMRTNKATGGQEKKGNVYLSSFLFHFYSFLALSFILSFFLFFSPSLSPILSLSLCFSLILSAFRYFSVSSYLSFNYPF